MRVKRITSVGRVNERNARPSFVFTQSSNKVDTSSTFASILQAEVERYATVKDVTYFKKEEL